MGENPISQQIVDSSYQIHKTFGPGLLESVYEAALAYELRKRGLKLERQLPVPVVCDGICIEKGKMIVEIKSIETVAPVHKKQLLTYLRLMDN